MTEELLEVARKILSEPTAPFHEEAVSARICGLLAECPHVEVSEDGFGNLIARYQRGANPGRLAFAAHMDHPAYVQEPGSTERIFLGGVPEEYRAKNPPTEGFGRFAMWKLPAFELRDGRIYSRACDDLIGCAVIVSMFQNLERDGAETTVYGLFTRAEEVGFVGAIQLAKSGRLPTEVTIVSLETSSERGGACKMGDGVIVRVGDKTSVFDSDATARFSAWAKEGSIPFQRTLMSGGTCEASAYQLYGYTSAALCVALGNYHNCGPEQHIASEFVAVADVEAMLALCLQGALALEPEDPRAALRERLEKGLIEHARFYA